MVCLGILIWRYSYITCNGNVHISWFNKLERVLVTQSVDLVWTFSIMLVQGRKHIVFWTINQREEIKQAALTANSQIHFCKIFLLCREKNRIEMKSDSFPHKQLSSLLISLRLTFCARKLVIFLFSRQGLVGEWETLFECITAKSHIIDIDTHEHPISWRFNTLCFSLSS